MALMLGRIAAQRPLNGLHFRVPNYSLVKHVSIRATPCPPAGTETFDEKNARLKRPQSPHLTIYKFQLTSMLSITHRATGMALGGYLAALGIGALVSPVEFPVMIDYISSMHISPVILTSAKALIAFPAAYHFVNGIRHLAWDTGKFLTIKEVYLTGYITLVASAIFTGWLVSL